MPKVGVNFKSFTVEGIGKFPVDMLRYDMCWPKTQQDAINLTPLEPHVGYTVKRQVTLVGIKDTSPTVDRWASFGWEVTR